MPLIGVNMNIENMSSQEIRDLTAQLDVIKAAGLAKYNKGDMLVDDITVNKGGGLSLRFKGSRFPVNMYGSQLAQLAKHIDRVMSKAKELGVSLEVK